MVNQLQVKAGWTKEQGTCILPRDAWGYWSEGLVRASLLQTTPSPLESQSKYLADALGAHCITEAACSLRSPEWHFVCAALVLYLLYLSHRNMRWGGKEGSGGILEAGRE